MSQKKTSLLAWLLFAAVVALASLSLLNLLANREAQQDLLSLVNDMVWCVVPVEFAFLAALILSRQPRNAIGWLVLMPAIALAADDTLQIYISNFTTTPPTPTPLLMLMMWFSSWSWILFIFPIFFILLLFPTGQPTSPRWRWVTYYALGVSAFAFLVIAFQEQIAPPNVDWSIANPVGFIPPEWFEQYLVLPFALGLLPTVVLSVASIIVRYRHAYAVEREQIKWLLVACAFFAAAYSLAFSFNLFSEKWGSGPEWIYIPLTLAVMSIPAAIAIAILRYRLWDIDVIIRRTLIYGALTATLAIVFFGGVALLQQAFGTLTGTENSPVAIVISTLAIVALFNPLRRRVQDFIDRRFYRHKYDAEKILAAFAVTARDETDLDRLTAELVRVAQETMQPELASLWLKEDDKAQAGVLTR